MRTKVGFLGLKVINVLVLQIVGTLYLLIIIVSLLTTLFKSPTIYLSFYQQL